MHGLLKGQHLQPLAGRGGTKFLCAHRKGVEKGGEREGEEGKEISIEQYQELTGGEVRQNSLVNSILLPIVHLKHEKRNEANKQRPNLEAHRLGQT